MIINSDTNWDEIDENDIDWQPAKEDMQFETILDHGIEGVQNCSFCKQKTESYMVLALLVKGETKKDHVLISCPGCNQKNWG